MKIENYADCLAELKGKNRKLSLLMGNGFSMAYDHEIFSYNALQIFIVELNDPILDKLFEVVKSKNLEVIMQQLHVLSQLLDVFSNSNDELKTKIIAADTALRQGLIDAVKALHPEHVFKIPENKIATCYKFLEPFLTGTGNIFTTNYDILLYWVLMRSGYHNHNDGFGYELENPEEPDPDKHIHSTVLTWGCFNGGKQNLHYLHGALHLFDNGINIEKETYNEGKYLLEYIEERMDNNEYPVFVTAGDGDEKLSQIMHNQYLQYCYQNLCSIQGSLIAFGFNFGPYDEHIIKAINQAAHHGRKSGDKLFSVYIGVYSEEDVKHVNSIAGKFRCKVRMFDAKTASVWGD